MTEVCADMDLQLNQAAIWVGSGAIFLAEPIDEFGKHWMESCKNYKTAAQKAMD